MKETSMSPHIGYIRMSCPKQKKRSAREEKLLRKEGIRGERQDKAGERGWNENLPSKLTRVEMNGSTWGEEGEMDRNSGAFKGKKKKKGKKKEREKKNLGLRRKACRGKE